MADGINVNGGIKGFARKVINVPRKLKFVNAGTEFKGLTSPTYRLGNYIRNTSRTQADMRRWGRLGLALNYLKTEVNVRTYLPKYQDTEKNIKVIDEKELTIHTRDEIKVKVSQVEPPKDEVEYPANSSVFLIENDMLFSAFDLYSKKEDWIQPWVVFALTILEHLKETKFCPDVIHCNEWQTGLLPIYLKALYGLNDNGFYANTSSLFAVHNHKHLGLFPEDQWQLLLLLGDLYFHDALGLNNQVSLLKAGMMYSDKVIFNSEEELGSAISDADIQEMGKFVGQLKEKGKAVGILPKKIDIYETLPEDYIKNVVGIYLGLIRGEK